jgi:alpha-glucosidase
MKNLIRLMGAMVIYMMSTSLAAFSQNNNIELQSPDGLMNMTFRTEKAQLQYDISFQGKQIIQPSLLGLELERRPVLGNNVEITNYSFHQGEDNYHLLTGKTSYVKEKYKAVIIEVAELTTPHRLMRIEARAYNGGIAFRYLVPEQPSMLEYRLKNEKTEFNIAKDPIVYAHVVPHFRSGYEREHLKVPGTGLSPQGFNTRFLVSLPLLMNIEGTAWAVITEADLENNSGLYVSNLRGGSKGAFFEAVVSPNLNNEDISVVSKLPHKSAWRVIMVADNPGRFIESNIITNLNPDCRIADTSWIQPGKSAWDWWCGRLNKDGEVQFTTENMKYYVNFATESGLEYMIVDDGWSDSDITQYHDYINIPEIARYAKSKGVKLFIWLRSEHVWNRAEEVFPLYKKWGVSGLKIDFVERDDQAGIDFYYRIAEEAAKHQLLVDFHGSCKPWGIQRTYPNVVGYEAVVGMEMSKEAGRDNPDNHLIIPYTRMLQGSMDYTPGGFNNITAEAFKGRFVKPMVMGTRAHHLAMYVVYESPFQMVSDWPEHYRNEPSFEFIKEVPTVWDETKVINGYPGEYISVARKKGDDWYLGAMTNWTSRSFEIELDFLGNGNYIATIYSDASDSDKYPKKINIKSTQVKAKGKLKVNMVSAGGLAIHFKKAK